VSHCRQNPANTMLNACPPQQSEYHGMIPENQLNQSVPYSDPVMHRDHSQVPGMEQGGYSNGNEERWPVSGHGLHDGSPNASFRSHYSGYDEPALGERMIWHSREEVRTLFLWTTLH